MRELFANTTLYETLKKFDDIPFIIYGKLQVQVSHPDKPVSACCN